jgi:hypothetical protein
VAPIAHDAPKDRMVDAASQHSGRCPLEGGQVLLITLSP